MREGPLDILDRSRYYFLKSLSDDISKVDAATEFYWDTVSAQRRGYLLSAGDDALVKMFYHIMKDDDSSEEQIASSPTDFSEVKVAEHAVGQQLVDGSVQDGRVVPPNPNGGLTGRHIEMDDGNPDDPYATINPLGHDFNPLHDKYHHQVGDFYVNPTDASRTSESEKAHKKEMAWEAHNDEPSRQFLRGGSHYGQITEQGTNHSHYLQDFSNWKMSNDKAIDELKARCEEEGMSTRQTEHQVELAHINEKKKEWKQNLGFFDYLHGLEWMTPEQRNKAYEHMGKHGTDDKDKPFEGHSTGHSHHDWLPRIKRNFAQRFAGVYAHWVRAQNHPGNGIMSRRKNLPAKTNIVGVEDNLKSLRSHTVEGKGNAYEIAMSYIKNRTNYQGGLLGKPFIHTESRAEGQPAASFLSGGKSLQFRSTEPGRNDGPSADRGSLGINKEMHRLLLNVDENDKIYGDGQHPLYPDWETSQSPFTQERIDTIIALAQSEAKKKYATRIGQNENMMQVGTFIDPASYHEYVAGDEETPNETLSTYWQRPWFKGGMGKPPNQLFDIMHQHSLLYEKGDSVASMESEIQAAQMDRERREAGLPKEEEGFPISRDEYNQEHSLLFSRGNNHIVTRARRDSKGGEIDNSMSGMLGSFGQPQQLITNTASGNIEHLTGDATDALVTFEPHNVRYSSSMGGSAPKAHTERHSSTSHPLLHNRLMALYHEARERGDTETYNHLHKVLTRGKSNVRMAPLDNPFTGKGGAFEYASKIRRSAHNAHKIATMMGFKRAPGNPQRGVLSLDDPDVEHSTFDEGDLGRMRMVDPKSQSLEGEGLENYIQSLHDEYKEGMARVDGADYTDKEKAEWRGAIEGGYQRALEKVGKKFIHDPTATSTLQGLKNKLSMAEFNTPALGNANEIDDKRLTMRTAPGGTLSEDEEELNRLTDSAALIEAQLKAGKRITFDEFHREAAMKEPEKDRGVTPTREHDDLSEEDMAEMTHKLHEMNEEIAHKDRLVMEGTSPAKAASKLHNYDEDSQRTQLNHDTDAIDKMGVHLSNMMGDYRDKILDPNLPLKTIEANIRMLAKMANDYAHIAPFDAHGITKQGMDDLAVERVMPGGALSSDAKRVVHDSPVRVNFDMLRDLKGFAEVLGLPDYDSNLHVQSTILGFMDMFEKKWKESGDPNFSLPVMSVGQYLKASGKVDPDMDFDEMLSIKNPRVKARKTEESKNLYKLTQEISNGIKPYDSTLKRGAPGAKADIDKLNAQVGLVYHNAHNADDRHHLFPGEDVRNDSTRNRSPKGKGAGKNPVVNDSSDGKAVSDGYNAQQVLHSLLFSDPNVEPKEAQSVSTTKHGFGEVPIDAYGPDSHSVDSVYNSSGLRHEFGDDFTPTFNYHIHPDGTIEMSGNTKSFRLVQPLSGFRQAVAPDLSHHLAPDYVHHDGSTQADLNEKDKFAAQFRMSSTGVVTHYDVDSAAKSEIGLAGLTNPDVIRKELGKEVPLLQPMHRIFKLADLEHLRGFTGDWLVSVMPEGERGFVKKDDDEVSAKPFTLSKEDKENFKKVTSKDFHVDVIKTEDGYYIFDVIEYDEKEVHDTLLDDRIKILRGGMEGVENIHVPSASDTRLTDDAGLELIVEDLQKEHDKLLLRDAKSTYMVGELRHPKWVTLNEGSDVVLRVLERRGDGPYTYRLGTGPITQEEDIGDRAVESGGETYMDVGAAFDSPDKYNEGDHVRVNVSNVGETETSSGQKIYTVSSSDVKEEAEGESLVSQETLSILTKSESSQWLCEVSRASSGLRVTMPQGDVLYKCTQSGTMWTVHSPLASNSYLIRLSESQRRYWSPVAGALLKADLEIREEEDENGGFSADGIEPGEPLIKPKKIKGTDWWDEEQKKKILVKGLQLVERLIKSGAGSVGQSSTGAMGLGIDYATPIESPTGPTNLHDEKTMPDFDGKNRPGEDSYIEPGAEDRKPTKHFSLPLKEGNLEVTSDSATFLLD